MNLPDRLARRRRLVLEALGDAEADTAAVRRLTGGHFYDVLATLDELRIEGVVERVGHRWRLVEHEREPGQVRADPNIGTCHKPMIGTEAPDLEPVDNPVDNLSTPVHIPLVNTAAPNLSTGYAHAANPRPERPPGRYQQADGSPTPTSVLNEI